MSGCTSCLSAGQRVQKGAGLWKNSRAQKHHFVGIVHPCKIYNILTLGIPFLFIGPDQSHGADLARRLNDPAQGRVARNGDVPAIVQQIREAMALGPQPVNAAARALGAEFSHSVLCPRLVQVIEQAGARS